MTDADGETGVGGEHQDGYGGLEGAHAGGDFGSVQAGHRVVEHDRGDRLLRKETNAGLAVERGQDLVSGTLEQDATDLKADVFVVDTEDEWRVSCRGFHFRHLGQFI